MIPVCKPYWGAEEEAAALRVMRSGRLIQGPEVAEFERMVAEFVGVKYAVACSSGTTALHLTLMAAGVGPGDEVLVPAFTFVATANAVLMCGAKPKLCDIDLETFCMESETKWFLPDCAPKLNLPVLAFGYPIMVGGNINAPRLFIDSLQADRAVLDAACALGSVQLGDALAATLSFHATKIITTGEGGMVVTNDTDIGARCHFLRDQKHGNGLAYNYRMTEIQGAIGQEQMKKLPWILQRRKELAERYDHCFDGKIRARIPPKGGNYQSYVLLLNQDIDRSKVITDLHDCGVESLLGTQFLGDMQHLKTEGLPNARFAGSHAMRIPIFPQMTEEEIAHVIIKVLEVLG